MEKKTGRVRLLLQAGFGAWIVYANPAGFEDPEPPSDACALDLRSEGSVLHRSERLGYRPGNTPTPAPLFGGNRRMSAKSDPVRDQTAASAVEILNYRTSSITFSFSCQTVCTA